MNNKLLIGLLAGLSVPFLVATEANAAEREGQYAQSGTEAGQTDTKGDGTADKNIKDQQTTPGAAGTGGGATTMGQPPGGSENHAEEALKHAKAAAGSGKKGDFSSIAKHAQLSKTHVEAALKDKPDDPHLQAALKSLDEAIAEGNRSNGDKARKAAKEAVAHLKAVK